MRKLEEILEEYESLRESFKLFRSRGDSNRDALNEFQGRFVDLKADLREHKKSLTSEWIRRDDKAATAIKFRIAIAISNGEFKNEDGDLIYDECSISAAEKYASGSKKYKEFVDQRAFYKESLVNITDLREDINSFINLIKDLLK